jgi:hypothetical protein
MNTAGWVQFLKKKERNEEGDVDDDELLDQLHHGQPLGVVIPNSKVLIDSCLGTSVAMFARVLRHKIDQENGSAGPLKSPFNTYLGKIVCERVTPFPCRTFDTTTLYIVNSFPQWLTKYGVTHSHEASSTFDVRTRPEFASFTAHAIANLLFGVIFCRSTGRVNALHHFSKHVKQLETESSQLLPFMPELTHLNVLLSFL